MSSLFHGSRDLRRGKNSETWGRKARFALVAGAFSVAGAVGSPAIAQAVTGYHVVVGSAGLNAHNGPGAAYSIVGHLANGQAIDIACQTKGTLIGIGLTGTPTDVWDQLTNGWYITDYYTSTPGLAGGYTPGIPECGSAPTPAPTPTPLPTSIYNRTTATSWALNNFDKANGSRFFKPNSGDDCTYFVSQALWAGGIPKTDNWTNNSVNLNDLASRLWIPGPTKDAAEADYFKNYVVNNQIATIKQISWTDITAGGAQVGDIIGYDWNAPEDGKLDHVAIVTDVNAAGSRFVSQHSPSQQNRLWSWDSDGKNWIQITHPGARAYLIHIIK